METPSPLNRCAVVLCYVAAGFLAAGTWRDYVANPNPVGQPFQRYSLTRLTTMLSHAPTTLITANTRIEINLSQRQLILYQNDMVQAEFPVAIGQDDWQTPLGDFAVRDMRVDPVWRHPITKEAVQSGPTNPLGSRWIGFATDGDYHIGIHGTNQEDSIGEAVSHGCVRMFDHDIQSLYSRVTVGTPIIVKP
ncbi:L,D-transpeptidase [Nodosilinea sp. P-1105]|uniref:L,D-transpeptidase n=1 Tax=Nodosilinea sp. P-1105 TaxID=2546229 RepID=UPI00146BE6E0|nr:L,D-transpeptidase [Nodosilinea sp. P-1105]NMF84292.1 L,D-transpeptidase [Nodosilinea sp. P-1105]